MRVYFCDCCFLMKGEFVPAAIKAQVEDGYKRLRVDFCPEHKDFVKGLDFTQAQAKIAALYKGATNIKVGVDKVPVKTTLH